jgi:hypothetical protein
MNTRPFAAAVVAASLAFAVASCSRGGGPSSYKDVKQALDPNTEPVQVSLRVDSSHTATAEIGPDGGTLTATGADGTRFTLAIPAKALVETVEIGMTPITSMDGVPWKGDLVGAVQLEPDGQTFYDYVTLRIQPPGDVDLGKIIPIGASGQDHDLFIPFTDPNANALTLKLDHFSSAGATKGLLADIEPWRQRLGGDVEARLQSIASAELERSRQAIAAGRPDPMDPGFWPWLIATWKQYVLQPRLEASGESCAAGRLAIQTLLDMQRQMTLLGIPDTLGVDVSDLLPKVAGVCIQEEYELCRDQHIVHRILPAILGLERQAVLLGLASDESALGAPSGGSGSSAMDQVIAHAWDLAGKCLNFEVQFESTAKMQTADGSFTSTVESTVPIQFDPSTPMTGPHGSAALENTDFEFKPDRCSATGIPGGGTFQVLSLTWDAAPPDANYPYGHVKAIHLTYDPGNTSESEKVSCPGARTITAGPMPMWTMAFEALHMGELSGTPGGNAGPSLPNLGNLLGGSGLPNLSGLPGMANLPGLGGQSQSGTPSTNSGSGMTLTASEWAVRGGELFAQKEWQTSVNMVTSGTEQGSFKLYHRPQ